MSFMDTHQHQIQQRNAFFAGAFSVSILWCISSIWRRRKNYIAINNLDDIISNGISINDNDSDCSYSLTTHHTTTHHTTTTTTHQDTTTTQDQDQEQLPIRTQKSDDSFIYKIRNEINNYNKNKDNYDIHDIHELIDEYNPWKTKEAVEYRQKMVEKALEHYSRDGALKIIVDKIMSRTRRIGELPSKIIRERWPWESLRNPKSNDDDGGVDEDEDSNNNSNNNSNNSNDADSHSINYNNSGSSEQQERFNDRNNNTTNTAYTTYNGSTNHTTEGNSSSNPNSISSENNIHNNQKSIQINASIEEEEEEEETKSHACIGSIFGMDVGGTLSKLLYFEKKPQSQKRSISDITDSQPISTPSGFGLGRSAGARSSTSTSTSTNTEFRTRSQMGLMMKSKSLQANAFSSSTPVFRRPSGRSSLLQKQDSTDSSNYSDNDNDNEGINTHNIRANGTQSIDEGDESDESSDGSEMKIHNYNKDNDDGDDDDDDDDNDMKDARFSDTPPKLNEELKQSKLSRSYSMFDIASKEEERQQALDRFYTFVRQLDTYESGLKDQSRSFYSRSLGGEFHFIQFETRYIDQAMDLIKVNDLHKNISEFGATGGGAHKYDEMWDKQLGIKISKQDELDSLVAGMQFILADVVGECYTFKPNEKAFEAAMKKRMSDENMNKNNNDNDADNSNSNSNSSHSMNSTDSEASSDFFIESKKASKAAKKMIDDEAQDSKSLDEHGKKKDPTSKKIHGLDQYWWSRKVKRDFIAKSDSYPYLLVMIGTGVSVLRVDGPRKHERISGSTIGGGTYWGLCRLLTDAEDFESVLNLAQRGDPSKVDMMVGDIYGQESDALDKLGLTADIVASSFGKLVTKQHPARDLTQDDLARALLLMVTNNIGQVAYLNAKLHNTERIYFVGNFLRQNVLSQKRLAYAINYWSSGKMEALFLEHEGYFGALGAFLLHQGIPQPRSGEIPNTDGVKHSSPTSRKRSDSY